MPAKNYGGDSQNSPCHESRKQQGKGMSAADPSSYRSGQLEVTPAHGSEKKENKNTSPQNHRSKHPIS